MEIEPSGQTRRAIAPLRTLFGAPGLDLLGKCKPGDGGATAVLALVRTPPHDDAIGGRRVAVLVLEGHPYGRVVGRIDA